MCAPTLKALRTVTAAAASASCGSALGGCHRVGRRVTGLRKCDQLGVLPACWRLKILIRKRGRALSLFVGQRVLARSLTRYRQEWSYASRCVSEAFEDAYDGGLHWAERCETPDPAVSARMIDLLHNAISLLPESKRNLIRQLFFENESETEVARALGISQPAVNKRKWTILDNLRKRLAPEKIS